MTMGRSSFSIHAIIRFITYISISYLITKSESAVSIKNFYFSPQNDVSNTTNSVKTIELILVTDYVYYQKIRDDQKSSNPEITEAEIDQAIRDNVSLMYTTLKSAYHQLHTNVVLLRLFIHKKKDEWQDNLTAAITKNGTLDECCWNYEKTGCENANRKKGTDC